MRWIRNPLSFWARLPAAGISSCEPKKPCVSLGGVRPPRPCITPPLSASAMHSPSSVQAGEHPISPTLPMPSPAAAGEFPPSAPRARTQRSLLTVREAFPDASQGDDRHRSPRRHQQGNGAAIENEKDTDPDGAILPAARNNSNPDDADVIKSVKADSSIAKHIHEFVTNQVDLKLSKAPPWCERG